jgi:hypothetical protein
MESGMIGFVSLPAKQVELISRQAAGILEAERANKSDAALSGFMDRENAKRGVMIQIGRKCPLLRTKEEAAAHAKYMDFSWVSPKKPLQEKAEALMASAATCIETCGGDPQIFVDLKLWGDLVYAGRQ